MKTFETWKEHAMKTWPNLDEQTLRAIYEDISKEQGLDAIVKALNAYSEEEGFEDHYTLEELRRDMDNGEELGIMFTTHGANEEHLLQASYDLNSLRLVGYLDGAEIQSVNFQNLGQIADDIRNSSWDSYYSWMTDAEEVQAVLDLETAECDVCYAFNPMVYEHAEDLQKAYREKTGDDPDFMGRFDQGKAGTWCMDHDDDLGSSWLRTLLDCRADALAYYEEVTR